MKMLWRWWVVLGLVVTALADVPADPKQWPEALEVLKNVAAESLPAKPVDWQSPEGPIVLHGDLFGDGRHLALVGNSRTTLAEGTKAGWRILSNVEVCPAWLPVGTKSEDRGYFQITPPAKPFVLKDLDGDHVPEVLIAFDNDGGSVGYAITKKSDQGMKPLDIRSEMGEPVRVGVYATVTSEISGRKSWWSGKTYYKWTNGVPFPVGTWIEDSTDPERMRFIALRHAKGKVSNAFEVVKDDAGWVVLSCTWNGGVKTSDQKPCAKVRFIREPAEAAEDSSFLAEMVLMFELSTGIKGTASILPKGNQEGFDLAKATEGLRFEVVGSEEAKKILKRVP